MSPAQLKWLVQLGTAVITVAGLIEQGRRRGWL